MAQGTGLPGLPQPSDFATEAEGPDPSSAGAGWAAVAHVSDQLNQEFGTADALYEAHQHVVDQAQLASIRTGIDAQQAELAGSNPGDAQGFASAASQARSQVISAAPARYKMQAATYWDQSARTTQAKVAVAGMAQDHVLAGQGIQARIGTVTNTAKDELSSGAPLAVATQSPGYVASMAEATQLRQSLVAGKFISQEQADAQAADAAVELKAAAFQGHVLQVFQAQGAKAATAEVERFSQAGAPGAQPDPNSWDAGVDLTSHERQLMQAKGYAALQQQVSMANAQTAAANLQTQAQQHALSLRMQDEVDYQLKHGAPSGKGPTDDEVRSAFGASKIAEFTTQKANALQQNRDDGITPGMTSDQIAEHAAAKAAMKPLDLDLSTPEKMDSLELAIRGTEGGVRGGVPLMSSQGAMGSSQILLGTARQVAQQHGLANVSAMSDAQLHAALMGGDQTLNTQLGHLYVQDLAAKYGDPRLVSLAYHNGPGYVDKAIGLLGRPDADIPYEEWLAGVRHGVPGKLDAAPKGAQYVQEVADRMGSAQRIVAAQATVQRANEVTTQAVGDPVAFAQSHGWGQPAPLPLDGFLGGSQSQAWGQGLVARQSQAAVIAQQHQGLPPRLLSNAEASYYRDRLAADPALGPQMAAAATRALGTDGAVRLMREVGQTDAAASVGVQTGLLAASGHAGARFAGSVVSGLQAKQQGAKDGPLPKGVTWEKAQAAIAPAFSQMGPGTLAGVMQVAQLAHLGESQNATPVAPDQYLRSAMGGWTNAQTGEAFGGVAPVNGAPTIHPVWMKVGTMPDAMMALAQTGRLGRAPPVYANGQPMRAQAVAQTQPVAMPDGSYLLRDTRTGKALRTSNGSFFHLDLDAAKPFLAARGGIVAQGY